MKKVFSVILCAAVVLTTGCETKKQQISRIMAENREERENSIREESIAREAEIEEVDKWGISLDDVDQLAKHAIRRHENVSNYKQSYNDAIRKTDEYLDDIESGKKTEDGLDIFFENYKATCEAGIEYIEACVDVELMYNMYTQDNEFDKTEKDLIRTFLTMFNPSIERVEQSVTDMENLLSPIIEENRTLTDDELEIVYEIYQILTDEVDNASKTY